MARKTSSTAPTAEAWAHAGERKVHLPSGAGTATIRPGSLPRAILGGRIPDVLRGMARRVEYQGVNPTELVEDEDITAFEDFKDWWVAECLVSPTVDADFVREQMPSEDREMLWLHAIHAIPADLEGRVRSLLDLATFRPGTGRTVAASDGGEAAAPAE